ncbi:MAG: UbiA family prenyltransferase [Halobacteriaceae archaeon]
MGERIGHVEGVLSPDGLRGAVVHSSAHLGVLAVAKGVVAFALLSVPLNAALVVGLLAAVPVYAHNRLRDGVEDGVNAPSRAAFLEGRERSLAVASAAAYLGALVVAALGGALALLLTAAPGVAGALYSETWIPVGDADRLKEVPVVNTAVVAGAWAVPLGVLPLAFADVAPGYGAAFVVAFFFLRTVVAVEVLNVRDVRGDRRADVPTLPADHGVDATRRVLAALDAATLALLLAGAATGAVPVPVALALLPALGCSVAVTALLTTGVDRSRLCACKDAEYVLMACCVLAVGVVGA